MSAGAGIRHQEHNPTDQPLRIFQIWIRPREDGGAARWDSRKFPESDRAASWLRSRAEMTAMAMHFRFEPRRACSGRRFSSLER
jgi:redox-sensitive bicupin YhaK (pirin superfamily)